MRVFSRLGFVRLHRSVLRVVDERCGGLSRAGFIAQAVAHEVERQANGRGVIMDETGCPRFIPEGLLGSGGVVDYRPPPWRRFAVGPPFQEGN